MLMKLTYALALISIALTTTSAAQPVTDVSPAIHVGDMTFSGEKVLLRSADGAAGQLSCTLEGQAKVVLFSGDIEVTADRIQLELNGDLPVSIICSGSCRYKQTDAKQISVWEQTHFGRGWPPSYRKRHTSVRYGKRQDCAIGRVDYRHRWKI